jgi:FkbM family methyltransferase
MKCYSFIDCTEEELVAYFKMMYKNDNCESEIIWKMDNNIVDLSLLNITDLNHAFVNATPFNHIVLDNIVNNNILNSALIEINSIPIDQLVPAYVYGIDNVQNNKFSYTDFNKLKYISEIKDYFESDIFINWLEQITGINNLQKDPDIDGGGIHIMKNNGTLGIHSDCNMHHLTKKYRRVNLLLYLNKDYDETYNGHLELWNAEMTKCKKKISPIFNRIVLFRVDDNANHGHPALWNGGQNDRTSLALYYYTDDRPEREKSETISAVWKTIRKPKCFIIHNNTVGGAYKFLADIMKMYSNYDYAFIDNQKQLWSIEFNDTDLFILQNVLYTDIEIKDIINVRDKYEFKFLIIVHDFQWLCQEQHNYTSDIPSAYLSNNISVSNEIKQLLSLSDKVIMNSQFTYDVYSRHFDPSNFTLCYPNDYKVQSGIKNVPEIQNECINIGIFSPLCKFKGEIYVRYLKEKFECDTIVFKIVGHNIPYYKENEFYEYVRKYNINGFLMLNEWGETYGFLLTKIINSGLPLLYNNFGAVKERIDSTQKHYFKVYDKEHINDINDDYTVLDSQFNNFIEYINVNHGTVEDMNEDFTIVTRPIYDELFLPNVDVYQNREIPKVIFQTSKDVLPPYVKQLINMYCPNWKYSHFTDKECIQFFIDNPLTDFPEIIQKFHSFTQGQHKADIFRYYYLYLRGGVFLDSDAMFETNIGNIIQDYDSVFAKSFMKNEHLFNGFIATYPRNEIIYDALKHAYNTENNTLQTNYHYLCEELLRIVLSEQKKLSSQNMIIYQEYSDTIDGKGVGRFKNTRGETVFIHYWQDREIPSNLSTLVMAYTNNYMVDNYHYTKGIKFLTYPSDKCIISELISKNQVWESHMHKIFEKYINNESIVLEGGCHIGTHTLKLGLLGKQVLSFEPMIKSNIILRENLKINNITNVTVYNEGLSNKTDVAYFEWIGHNNPGGSGLTNNPMGKPNYEKNIKTSNYPVNLITIDSLQLDKLDFIKLDVEGYEINVIEGALDTIKKCNPIITMEVWENFNGKYSLQHAKNTFKILLDNGYTIHHIQGPDFLFLPSSRPTNDMLIKNVNNSAKTRMGNNIYSNLSYVNTLHKLVLSFTPRAGCSSVVKIYLDSLGLLQDAELYHPFIQAYRTDIMDPNIQSIPINQLKKDGYTFIKFIMNPYIRAVSIFRGQTSHNLSFRQYLKNLINNNVNYFNNNDKYHYHQQYITDEEKYITEYIKIDNNETYTYYHNEIKNILDPNKYTSPHHGTTKQKSNNTFCGDIPKNTINNQLPTSYKYFYDDEIKSMVELYYTDDIEKYNYEFFI